MSVEAKRVMEAPLGRAPRSFWFFFARFGGGGGMRKRARLMVLTVPLYTAIGRITTALDDDDDDAADDDADADADAETIVRLLSSTVYPRFPKFGGTSFNGKQRLEGGSKCVRIYVPVL